MGSHFGRGRPWPRWHRRRPLTRVVGRRPTRRWRRRPTSRWPPSGWPPAALVDDHKIRKVPLGRVLPWSDSCAPRIVQVLFPQLLGSVRFVQFSGSRIWRDEFRFFLDSRTLIANLELFSLGAFAFSQGVFGGVFLLWQLCPESPNSLSSSVFVRRDRLRRGALLIGTVFDLIEVLVVRLIGHGSSPFATETSVPPALEPLFRALLRRIIGLLRRGLRPVRRWRRRTILLCCALRWRLCLSALLRSTRRRAGILLVRGLGIVQLHIRKVGFRGVWGWWRLGPIIGLLRKFLASLIWVIRTTFVRSVFRILHAFFGRLCHFLSPLFLRVHPPVNLFHRPCDGGKYDDNRNQNKTPLKKESEHRSLLQRVDFPTQLFLAYGRPGREMHDRIGIIHVAARNGEADKLFRAHDLVVLPVRGSA